MYMYNEIYLVTTVDNSYNNYATSFYIGLMKHSDTYNYGGSLFFSTNTTDNVTYFVRYANSSYSTDNGTLTLGRSVRWYYISRNLQVVSSSFDNRFKGIHLETNLPITLYFIDNYAVHTYLALPCHDYQISQYEYYTVSTGSYRNTTISQALLVGCQNNTTVTITPSVDLFLPNNAQEPDDIDIVVSKGVSHTVLLHEGQTLYFGEPDVDITGTHIVSDKPLTVITGHECASRPDVTNRCSPLQLQVPPTVTWGTKYILPAITDSIYPVYVKIITADRDTTIISVCNETVNTTHYDTQGSVHSFYYNHSFNCYVEANKPILVTAFIRDYNYASLTLIPPMEQYSNKLDFSINSIDYYYTNIIVTTTPVGFSSSAILYNGQPITDWTTVYDSSMNIVGYVAEIRDYIYYLYSASIVHTDRDGKVSVLIDEVYYSMTYPAGMNLIPINKS